MLSEIPEIDGGLIGHISHLLCDLKYSLPLFAVCRPDAV